MRRVSTKLVRLISCAGAALICLGLAPTADQPSAKQAVDEQISAYKKAGDPTEPGDFANKPVAEKDNAAPILRAAYKSLDVESPIWKTFRENDDPTFPLTDTQTAAIRAVVDAHPGLTEQIDQAMLLPGVDWQVAWKSPTAQILVPQLGEMRQLSRFVLARALLSHQSGDDITAIADIRRAIYLSRVSDRMPMVIGHLVSLSILSNASDAAIQIAPDLRIGAAKGEASAHAVRSLVDTLLDFAPSRDGQQLAMLCERMYVVDCVRCLLNGTLDLKVFAGPDGKGPPHKPADFDPQKSWADTLILIHYVTAAAQAAKASPDFQTLKQKLPRVPPEAGSNNRAEHPILTLLTSPAQNTLRADYRAQATADLAAVALAVRGYLVDHPGDRPKALDDLAPKYLPAVPRDPMAVDQPLQYEASAKRFIVYSLGENGSNEAGTETSRTKKGVLTTDRWQAFDAVVHLDRPPGNQPAK